MDKPPSDNTPRLVPVIFRRMPVVDLVESIKSTNIESVLLDRIVEVTGLERLIDLKNLSAITMVHCGSTSPTSRMNAVLLQELYLHSLSQACLKSIITLTNSEEITIRHSDTPIVDLAMLRHHRRLKNLFLYCGIAIGIRHLENFPLERIHITNTELGPEFYKAALSWNNLQELWLENDKPFGPNELPEFPKLTSLIIPAHPEFLTAWREWRTEHPGVRLKFEPVTEGYYKMSSSSIEEIYKGIAILKVKKRGKTTFESWGDFREAFQILGDNHDFGDMILLQASKSKKKVKVFRESNQLGIRTVKLEDLKWSIDILANA